jgi:hypothetical protein
MVFDDPELKSAIGLLSFLDVSHLRRRQWTVAVLEC